MAEFLVTGNQCFIKNRFVGLGNGRAYGEKAFDLRGFIASTKPEISPRNDNLQRDASTMCNDVSHQQWKQSQSDTLLKS